MHPGASTSPILAQLVRSQLLDKAIYLEPDTDWDRLEQSMLYHSIAAPTIYGVRQNGWHLVPAEVQKRWEKIWLSHVQKNLMKVQEWQRLLRIFEANDIPVISLKGPALSVSAYGSTFLREFNDLDLLLQPSQAQAAADLLLQNGYRLRFAKLSKQMRLVLHSGNGEVDFLSVDKGIAVDLHWRLQQTMLPFQLSVDEAFHSAFLEEHEDAQYLSLSPEMQVLYLCMHGAKHCWQRMQWVCDLAFYLRNTPAIDWGRFHHLAKTSHCDYVIPHALLLVDKVLNLDMSERAGVQRNDQRSQQLSIKATALLDAGDNPGFFGSSGFHLALAKSWKQKGQYLFERIFVPTEMDWQWITLPRGLYFLYYAIRPLQILINLLKRIFSFGHPIQRHNAEQV